MVYPLFFHCIDSVSKQWGLHWSGCLLLHWEFWKWMMNVQHSSCLLVLRFSGMQKHTPAWSTLPQHTAYGLTWARALWDVTLPLALCSHVLLVLLSKPSAICPRVVFAVLLGYPGCYRLLLVSFAWSQPLCSIKCHILWGCREPPCGSPPMAGVQAGPKLGKK